MPSPTFPTVHHDVSFLITYYPALTTYDYPGGDSLRMTYDYPGGQLIFLENAEELFQNDRTIIDTPLEKSSRLIPAGTCLVLNPSKLFQLFEPHILVLSDTKDSIK